MYFLKLKIASFLLLRIRIRRKMFYKTSDFPVLQNYILFEEKKIIPRKNHAIFNFPINRVWSWPRAAFSNCKSRIWIKMLWIRSTTFPFVKLQFLPILNIFPFPCFFQWLRIVIDRGVDPDQVGSGFIWVRGSRGIKSIFFTGNYIFQVWTLGHHRRHSPDWKVKSFFWLLKDVLKSVWWFYWPGSWWIRIHIPGYRGHNY